MKPRHWAALGCGLLFGAGLAISQMSDPAKVLGFLDIAGAWDASLLFVLGSAVGVTVLFLRRVRKRARPIFDSAFEPEPIERIDRVLLGGSVVFGIGWGVAGYCPGPGIVSLGSGAPTAFAFVGAFLVGSYLVRAWRRWRPREPLAIG